MTNEWSVYWSHPTEKHNVRKVELSLVAFQAEWTHRWWAEPTTSFVADEVEGKLLAVLTVEHDRCLGVSQQEDLE